MTDEKIESIQMKAAIDEEKMDSDASKIDVVEEKFIKKEKVECSITKKEEEMTDDEESTNDGSEKVEKLNASVKDNKNDNKSIISEKDVENGDKSSEVNDSEIENGEKSSISDKDGEKMSEILDSESQAESEEEKEKKVFKLSVKKTEDLVTSTSSGFPNSASFNCSTCLIPFSSEKELEMHKSQMAHYICTASQKCMSIGYSSEAALAAHKAEMHSAQTQQSLPVQQIVHPVQQMVQQVERLPYPPQLSQVQISPVRQPQIPNLPGVQVTKRPISNPEPQSQPQPKVPRTSVTNLRLPQSITLTKPSPKKDVTNMLATRGITVVPSQGTSQSVPQRRVPTQLNSSVSITPSRQTLPTVDLTKDEPVRRRPHQPPTRRVCQICDKVFPSQDSLNSHLLTHRTPKQSFRCNICTAIYRSQVELDNHKMKFHPRRAQSQPVDLALPVVDVAQADVRQKLLQIGVRHVLRLSQLNNRSGTASFGLPIIPVDHANNPAFCSIGDMGASNLLPLGQLESL